MRKDELRERQHRELLVRRRRDEEQAIVNRIRSGADCPVRLPPVDPARLLYLDTDRDNGTAD